MTERTNELDVNGIPKLKKIEKDVSTPTAVSGTYTNMTGIAMLDSIGAALKAPGEWFAVDSHGMNFGVAALGVFGMLLAAGAITLGFS